MEKAETPTESERVLAGGDGNGVPGPDLEEGEPYLKPVKVEKREKAVELDEETSPVAGRRFSRS
jgi:hypothetical protein